MLVLTALSADTNSLQECCNNVNFINFVAEMLHISLFSNLSGEILELFAKLLFYWLFAYAGITTASELSKKLAIVLCCMHFLMLDELKHRLRIMSLSIYFRMMRLSSSGRCQPARER